MRISGDGKWLWAATTPILLDVFLFLSFRNKLMSSTEGNDLHRKKRMECHKGR